MSLQYLLYNWSSRVVTLVLNGSNQGTFWRNITVRLMGNGMEEKICGCEKCLIAFRVVCRIELINWYFYRKLLLPAFC